MQYENNTMGLAESRALVKMQAESTVDHQLIPSAVTRMKIDISESSEQGSHERGRQYWESPFEQSGCWQKRNYIEKFGRLQFGEIG